MALLPEGAKPGPSTNSNKRLKSENILGFHCHAIKNKIVNHSIQKVQNLGSRRR